MASHKYIERKWVNGRWEYKYRTDEKGSGQLKREADREMEYRDRMVRQNEKADKVKYPNGPNARQYNDALRKRNSREYDLRTIRNPEDHQDFLKTVYKNQSLGTKIKAGALSAADDAKEQAGKAKKAIAEKTAAAKKTVAEKTAAAKKMANDTTRKVSSLSSKAVDKGKATLSKYLDKFKKK